MWSFLSRTSGRGSKSGSKIPPRPGSVQPIYHQRPIEHAPAAALHRLCLSRYRTYRAPPMKVLTPALFLVVSNVFMTFAWYGHLKWSPQSRHASLAVIVAISWGIALLEYCFQVPGNRLGEQA